MAGVENGSFWSEIGSGFGDAGGTPPSKIPRSTSPPGKKLIPRRNLSKDGKQSEEAKWCTATAPLMRGVMVLFKPCLDVDIEKITADNFGRCIVAETIIDGSKIALVNIYAPNDATQQVVFLRDVSKEFLIPYANDNLVLGGDFNCTISTLDKKRR